VITFVNIGKWGRHGNQMFQYAATLSVARHHATDALMPLQNSTLKDCFVLGDVIDAMPSSLDLGFTQGDEFAFNDSIFKLPPNRNVDLFGYFQSEKYFKNIEEVVRKNFTFKSEVKERADEQIKSLNPERKHVSLHVRRGDYLNLTHVHPTPEISYYEEALKHFKHHTPVVFSDDIKWCKENLSHLQGDPVFVEGTDLYTDLCMMTLCDGHIIANSSFSWWGAWLGNNKTVAPARWFGEQGPQDWSDIYCEGWITC